MIVGESEKSLLISGQKARSILPKSNPTSRVCMLKESPVWFGDHIQMIPYFVLFTLRDIINSANSENVYDVFIARVP